MAITSFKASIFNLKVFVTIKQLILLIINDEMIIWNFRNCLNLLLVISIKNEHRNAF